MIGVAKLLDNPVSQQGSELSTLSVERKQLAIDNNTKM